MNLFIATGDCHLHNRKIQGRDRLPVVIQWMEEMTRLALEYGVEHIFLAGDVLDAKHGVERETLLALHGWLRRTATEGITVHWLRGNHETPRNQEWGNTLMKLFSEVCDIIVLPKVVRIGKHLVACHPWFPAGPYINGLRKVVRLLENVPSESRTLISHVGIREGRTSPSNIMLPQRVGLTDLYPDRWDLVLLGDYHDTQAWQDGRVRYMGSPLQHTYGDQRPDGPWLVDSESGKLACHSLRSRLRVRFPSFKTWTLAAGSDLKIDSYDARDYNRVTCGAEDEPLVKALYPDAKVVPVWSTSKIDLSKSRVSTEDVSDPKKLVERYLRMKGAYSENVAKFALRLLGDASKT